MLKNYFLLAIRNLFKYKTTSLINILGLAVGMTACFLITKYVQYEFSYDAFHKNSENIYRVLTPLEKYKSSVSGETPLPMAQAIKNTVPGFPKAARIAGLRKLNSICYKDNLFTETNIRIADPDIFDVFSIELIKGNKETALVEPNSVVINKEIADKYFGDEDPINKIIKIADVELAVKGVMPNLPDNSSLKFRVLISFSTFNSHYQRFLNDWLNPFCQTYVLVNSPLPAKELKENIYNALINNFPQDSKEAGFSVQLQPLTRIHLFSKQDFGLEEEGGNYNILVIYGLFALFILLIACINFINLSIGHLSGRFKEVGLRKLLGAEKKHIFFQFWCEIISLCFISFALSLALSYLLLPYFNQLVSRNMPSAFSSANLFYFGLLFLFTCIIAGAIPSYLFSRYQSAEIFRGKIKLSGTNLLSKILITAQYALSIFFIICASIINRQVSHIFEMHRILDLNKVIVVSFNALSRENNSYNSLKNVYYNEIQENKIIKECAEAPGAVLYGEIECDGRKWMGGIHFKSGEYFNLFGIKVITGRNFDFHKFPSDSSNSALINESFAKDNNITDPVGKVVKEYGRSYTIVGIIEDEVYDLKIKVRPALYVYDNHLVSSLYCKVDNSNLKDAISFLQTKWNNIFPSAIFSYSFYDDNIHEQYAQDLTNQKIINIVSFLTLLISCFGVFGLTVLSISRRTKEIGIRKVLGASAARIIMLLTKDMILLILISSVIAAPAAYFYMHNWLNDFFYRIDITATVFIFSTLLTIGITLIIVGAKTAKTALINPVDSLRYE